MNLGEDYSRSITRKFDYIPVYLPDTKIKPGAVLSFGTNIVGRPSKPFGSFDFITDLIKGDTYDFPILIKEHQSNITFNFVSQNEVKVSAAVQGEVPNVANGDIKFTFGKKGSILLYGIKPTESRIDELQLKKHINTVINDQHWEDFYFVTSVITCKKALIYQSNDRDGSLVVSASVKNLGVSGSEISNVDLNASFDVKWKSKQSFSIDWADNVVLFMKLIRFSKKGDIIEFEKATMSKGSDDQLKLEIIKVDPKELLEEE